MRFAVIAALLAFASPAAAQPVFVTFAGQKADEVRGRISAACLDREWHVDEIEGATVKCIRPGVPEMMVMNGPRGARWAVVVEYTLIGLPDETRVQVSEYIRSVNALGMRRVHNDEPEGEADAGIALLRRIGGE